MKKLGIVLLTVLMSATISVLLLPAGRRWLGSRDNDHWTRRLAWQWIGTVTISVAAMLLFAEVAEDIYDREPGSFDVAVRAWVLAHHTPVLDAVVPVLTWAGSAFVLIPMVLFVAWWMGNQRGRPAAAVTLVVPVIATATELFLKQVFARPRPAGAVTAQLISYSFPSGHAIAATSVSLTLGYVLYREGMLRRWVAVLIGLVPIIVGLTRVYLDVHWTTDVIGGWCAGLVAATACAALYEHQRAKRYHLRLTDPDRGASATPSL